MSEEIRSMKEELSSMRSEMNDVLEVLKIAKSKNVSTIIIPEGVSATGS